MTPAPINAVIKMMRNSIITYNGTNINISFDKTVIVYPTKSCSTFSEIQDTFIFYRKSFNFIIGYFKLGILFFKKITYIE